MILFKKAKDLRKWLDAQQEKAKPIGFIPTMGALHRGHLSLIEASKKENPVTVCSIFVNPAQFNDPKDFEKYPVTLEKDIDMLEESGCDLLFFPSVREIYPEGTSKAGHYELGSFETVLEGKFRPGHFQGVCMVVHRLLDIVQPHNLYLGQKDYQQCMVITKLIELTGHTGKITVNICPTLRETDGLAMSSRNMRLNADERGKATTIFKSLLFIKENLQRGNIEELKLHAGSMLLQNGLKPDYVEIADANNLSAVTEWDGKQKLVGLAAAFLNEVRLIDNMLMN
ncbi:MAG: pantoate--beta-alanine ligase [Bacteroidota bacterium]